ncbi:hypothetical protein R1flu_011316 [Riccia fluitans]|uniref:F-box domain-containing protein n=1 Tax=Riccia fluitans TaxID=41844 RepID=A0ABD1Z9Z2_9MARC
MLTVRHCLNPHGAVEEDEDERDPLCGPKVLGNEENPVPLQLPEFLVEKIVAKVPFPHILKARQLSKQWKSKFSRVVAQVSPNWPEFYPAYFCKQRCRVEGYDREKRSIKRMGRRNIKPGGLDSSVTCCGTLMVAVEFIPELSYLQPMATVTNLLTRRSRKVICPITPFRFDGEVVMYSAPILAPFGTSHYELIIWFSLMTVPSEQFQMTGVQMYNSASDIWKIVMFEDPLGGSQSAAYVDGSLYCIPDLLSTARPVILKFDRSGAKTTIFLPDVDDQIHAELVYQTLVGCGSRVLAVRFEYNRRIEEFQVRILRVDIQSLEVVELTKRTLYVNTRFLFETVQHPVVASSNSVYILDGAPDMGESLMCIKRYNVKTNTWDMDFFPFNLQKNCWGHRNLLVFEPGLNPFIVP